MQSHIQIREEGSGSGSHLCKDPDVGRTRVDRKKASVWCVSGSEDSGEAGAGGGCCHSGRYLLSCNLNAYVLRSNPRPGSISHSWVSLTLGRGCRWGQAKARCP